MKTPSRRLLPIFCGLLLASITSSFAQQVREWTTTDGKKHSGSIMFMSSKSITLKSSRGMVSIPVAKLSAEDQKYIIQLKSNSKAVRMKNPGIPLNNLPTGINKPKPVPTSRPPIQKYTPPTVRANWPTEVKTSFSPSDITTVSETKNEGYIYRSPHFEFHSPHRLPHRAVREFSLVFESTYDLAKAMPIGLDPKPGRNGFYITQLYNTYEDYYNAGGPAGSAGSFFPRTGKIHVPLPALGVQRSNNNVKVIRGAAGNTLIHEVTHQVMMRWLPLIPIWMGEGFAEIASSLPYDSGRFRLVRMSTAVREGTGSGPGAGRSLVMLPLEELMPMSPQTWSAAVAGENAQQNYRSASALTYYFLRLDGNGDGKRLNAYINARLKGDKSRNPEEKYLLDGRSYKELEKEVARAWREEGLKITFRKQ